MKELKATFFKQKIMVILAIVVLISVTVSIIVSANTLPPVYNGIQTGTYIIENIDNGRYLHHTVDNDTVNVWKYGNYEHQKWIITKYTDGTYSFKSALYTSWYLEVYCGQYDNGQPITMYNYTENTSSPHIRFHILQNSDGTFCIKPKSSNHVLEVYTGTTTTQDYYNEYTESYRPFELIKDQSVILGTYTGEACQRWDIQNVNRFDFDTSLQNGLYYIKSIYNNKVLTHNTNENIVEAKNYQGSGMQRWNVTRNTDGTYHISPTSEPLFNVELYCGINKDGQPISLNNYTNNQNSPYIKVRMERDSNGNYSLYPITSPTRSISIYTGNTTTSVYNGRTFTKNQNEFVHLETGDIGSNQKWVFESAIGIYPEQATLTFGNTFDLDSIEVFPQLSNCTWSIIYGANNINYNAVEKTATARQSGTTVFRLSRPDGIELDFTLNVQIDKYPSELMMLFGFDYDTTVLIMDVYNKVDAAYPNETEDKKAWYCSRLLSSFNYTGGLWDSFAGIITDSDNLTTYCINTLGFTAQQVNTIETAIRNQHNQTEHPDFPHMQYAIATSLSYELGEYSGTGTVAEFFYEKRFSYLGGWLGDCVIRVNGITTVENDDYCADLDATNIYSYIENGNTYLEAHELYYNALSGGNRASIFLTHFTYDYVETTVVDFLYREESIPLRIKELIGATSSSYIAELSLIDNEVFLNQMKIKYPDSYNFLQNVKEHRHYMSDLV